MAINPWPVFKTHEDASCFNCGGDFIPAYPGKTFKTTRGDVPGNGQYYQACEKCRMLTFYDLATNAEGTR